MSFRASRVLQACRRLAACCEDGLSLVGVVHSAVSTPVVRAPDIGKQVPSGTNPHSSAVRIFSRSTGLGIYCAAELFGMKV